MEIHINKIYIRKYLPATSCVILGTILQSLILVYNGYPFLWGDSGGYISRAFTLTLDHHWSMIYSVFIRFASLHTSLVFVAIIQSLLLVSFIFLIFSKTFTTPLKYYGFLSTMILTAFCSSLPYTSNMIMADTFTAVGLLAIICLVNFSFRSLLAYFLLILLILVSSTTHTSNPPIFMLIVLLILPLRLIFKHLYFDTDKKYIIILSVSLILLIFFCNWFYRTTLVRFFHNNQTNTIATANKTNENDIVISNVRMHFIWNKLRKTSTYSRFLSEYCPNHNWPIICGGKLEKMNKTEIRRLFHSNNIDFYREIEEAGKIILFKPFYLFAGLKERITPALSLIVNNRIKPGYSNRLAAKTIVKYLPYDSQLLKKSKSNRVNLYRTFLGKKEAKYLELINNVIIWGSVTLAFVFFSVSWRKKWWHPGHFTIIVLFLAHFINVFLMGLFGNFHNIRYCMRTSWFLYVAFILMICHLIDFMKRLTIKVEKV